MCVCVCVSESEREKERERREEREREQNRTEMVKCGLLRMCASRVSIGRLRVITPLSSID